MTPNEIDEIQDNEGNKYWFADYTSQAVGANVMGQYAILNPRTNELTVQSSQTISSYINARRAMDLVNSGPTETFRAQGFKGTNMTFYNIFGTGAWVTPVIDSSQSFRGIAVVPATATSSELVAFGSSKSDAIEDYKRKLAQVKRAAELANTPLVEHTETFVVDRVDIGEKDIAVATKGVKREYVIDRQGFSHARFIEKRDTVEVSFMDNGNGAEKVNITKFRNITQGW